MDPHPEISGQAKQKKYWKHIRCKETADHKYYKCLTQADSLTSVAPFVFDRDGPLPVTLFWPFAISVEIRGNWRGFSVPVRQH